MLNQNVVCLEDWKEKKTLKDQCSIFLTMPTPELLAACDKVLEEVQRRPFKKELVEMAQTLIGAVIERVKVESGRSLTDLENESRTANEKYQSLKNFL